MITIGILGAMIEEVQSIKNHMTEVKTRTLGGRDYYTGKLYGVDTVLAFSRWGKVASSSTVTTLINVFGATTIIFTGVAGAVASELNIGDIVVSDGLYQHDMDARPIFPRHHIPLTDTVIFRPEKTWVEKAKLSAEDFVAHIDQFISKKTLEKFSVKNPKVYVGIIASGDQFISNAQTHDALQFEGEKVMAVEMEGAAVAHVCQEHGVPYIVIRTISDKADHSASVDFRSFVQEIAPHYAEGVIQGIYSRL